MINDIIEFIEKEGGLAKVVSISSLGIGLLIFIIQFSLITKNDPIPFDEIMKIKEKKSTQSFKLLVGRKRLPSYSRRKNKRTRARSRIL
jgi:hypothetical protein